MANVKDILRQINVRDGLFNAEEMKAMEQGYSVSESEGDALSSRTVSRDSVCSPEYLGGSTGYLGMQRAGMIPQEHMIAYEAQKVSALQVEIANQKAKFLKKMTGLERMMD